MEPQPEQPSDPATLDDAPSSPAVSPPRSRRALLTAALGGVAGAIAATLGRPAETNAAAGDSLKVGQANFAGGAGTRLTATSSGGAFWLTQNGFGSGVRGDSVNGHGGVFTTAHAARHGLLAQNTGAAGSGAAVKGEGGANIGVYGTSPNNAAVYGISTDSGTGVYGYSTNNVGVSGSSGTGYAGSFSGKMYVSGNLEVGGTLSKAGGAFRIDHPLDPANKLLQHSFVESPDMKNVYDGIVTTDASGEATVELPDWFEALNSDVRYQLTTIGDARAWVARKVRDNSFAIATDNANVEVSWLLTGIRSDAWAEAHRIEIELDKAADQKGKYLHPVEHGQLESQGVEYEPQQRAAQERERAMGGLPS